jgi:hypothetical protein
MTLLSSYQFGQDLSPTSCTLYKEEFHQISPVSSLIAEGKGLS